MKKFEIVDQIESLLGKPTTRLHMVSKSTLVDILAYMVGARQISLHPGGWPDDGLIKRNTHSCPHTPDERLLAAPDCPESHLHRQLP